MSPLHGLQGRFRKDGTTEYRARGRVMTLIKSPNGNHFYAAHPNWSWDWFSAIGMTTTRKAAIERIEALLANAT